MKVLEKAVEIATEFAPEDDLAFCDVRKLLGAAARKANALEEALSAALNTLTYIRYQTWPTNGLGIGLQPDQMDEVIENAERALNAAKRR